MLAVMPSSTLSDPYHHHDHGAGIRVLVFLLNGRHIKY